MTRCIFSPSWRRQRWPISLGRTRACAVAGDRISSLHSRPCYHGFYAAIMAAVPALLMLDHLGGIAAPRIEDSIVRSRFAEALEPLSPIRRSRSSSATPRALAEGSALRRSRPRRSRRQPSSIRASGTTSDLLLGVVLAVVALVGFVWAWRTISPRQRTRQFVERFVMALLIACSVVAILTTLGIVLSLIFESLRFFQKVPFLDFLFGTHWSPQSAFEGAGAEAQRQQRRSLRRDPALRRHAAHHRSSPCWSPRRSG